MSEVAVRALESRDIPAVLEIQKSSREASQWSEAAYCGLAQTGEKSWVAERNGEIAGFLIARVVAGEVEILNLAVRPDLRRQGIGATLLRSALLHGSQAGALRAFLEVRPSNRAARKFYEAHGFSLAGTRRNYYRAPDEDALILTLVLGAANSPTSQRRSK